MSFAFYEADVLKQSMEKLCDALKNFKWFAMRQNLDRTFPQLQIWFDSMKSW